ncbi:MAG: alpha/beta fold hydrolase [Candidatus Obscuribacterales bacterium]|nr:alpha/beta fold hydrolase [Cyanobacteria bacterium HKST-UBA01]MCB9466940.1 alpha/beta fold hydrolase [Candidatus Obscuribacterales bacterium]
MNEIIWGEQLDIAGPAGRIAASIHRPAESRDKGAVIFLHGLGGNRHEHNGIFTRMAARLAQEGVLALRFDFSGNGESDHDPEFMTLETMKADIDAVIEYLKNHEISPQEEISLIGLSLGGLLAAYAVSYRQDLKAAALWEPPFNLVATLKRLYGPMAFDRVRVRGYLQAGLMKLSAQFLGQFLELDAAAFVPLISKPVLLIQGEADQVVTMEDAARWESAFDKHADFDSFYLAGADHAFTSESDALSVIDHTMSWFARL